MIEKRDYNTAKCHYNPTVVCPYCEHEYISENENIQKNGTLHIDQCVNCNRTFTIEKTIITTFSTQPYENYYIDRRNHLNKQKQELEQEPMHEHYVQLAYNQLLKAIHNLNEEAKRHLKLKSRPKGR